jgi:ligand-binding SRPBCC domain-containing protein
MKTYQNISIIKCDIEKLFVFHLDFNNLKAITPSDTKVKLLDEIFVPKEGDILRLHTVKNFIPIVWEVKIQKLQSPTLLVDVALKSPFKFWKHSHIFRDLGNGFCELKDVVEYELPLGFIGKIFDFIVKYELKKMFNYRHEVTKNILESRK